MVASAPITAWRWAAELPGSVLPATMRVLAIVAGVVAFPVITALLCGFVWCCVEAISRY